MITNNNLKILVFDFISAIDEILFEVYTRMEFSYRQKKAANATAGQATLSMDYRYVQEDEFDHLIDKAFNILFQETIKFRKLKGRKLSPIDNYEQSGT